MITKFRLKSGKGMVHGFTTADGAAYGPGDIVDLPGTYEGEAWLERVDDPVKVAAPPSKLEPLIPEKFVETKEKPLSSLGKRRKGRNNK
jgi:hypothetical protein